MKKDLDIHGETGSPSKADGVSRRVVLGGAALVAGLGASAMMATSAAAKTSQEQAKYQGEPKGSAKCGSCSQFEAPDGCKLVEGKVAENGWCQLYAPKAG